MDLVVDANIFFAALIKESVTSDLLGKEVFHLFAPEYLLEEYRKYEMDVLQKTTRKTEDFQQYVDILLRKITFVALEE